MNARNFPTNLFFASHRKGMTYNLFCDFEKQDSPYYTAYLLRSGVFSEMQEVDPQPLMFPNAWRPYK